MYQQPETQTVQSPLYVPASLGEMKGWQLVEAIIAETVKQTRKG